MNLNIRLWIIAIVAGILFGALYIRLTSEVEATTQVCFCHNVNNNPHTICTSNAGLIFGHFGHVNNGQDYVGQCVSPTATPLPTPSASPVATPRATPVVEVDPTPTPERTPEPSETPRVQSTPAPAAPPEWSELCYYLRDSAECKSKSEVFGVENEQFGPQK